METTDTNQTEQTPVEMEELSHTDKIVGVFSEPSNMFQKVSLFPMRTIDWMLPLIILFIVIGAVRSLSMLNDEVYFEAKQKAIESIQKMADKGTIPADQVDASIDRVNKQMEFMRGPIGWVINIFSTLIFGFIFLLIIIGIYYLLIKYVLKGDGTYKHALVANGLTAYITLIQVIITGILTFVLGKIVQDTSVAAFTGADRSSILGFFLAKLDPTSIWAYIVLAIGFAKLFKASETTKYYILVFSLWIIGGLLFFFLGKAFPFLAGFGG